MKYTTTFIVFSSLLTVTSISILSGRGPTYLLITLSGITYIVAHQQTLSGFLDWSIHLAPIIASIVITETILRLRQATEDQIHRLETINTFSQHINSSLEMSQVLSLLNAALQKALIADTYYVGLVDNGTIRLDLFYDDGEYFSDVEISMNDTLAGWVIRNQESGNFIFARFKPRDSDSRLQKNIIGKTNPVYRGLEFPCEPHISTACLPWLHIKQIRSVLPI